MKTTTNTRSAARLISVSQIRRRAGTEGPRHDPYSYEEYTITRDAKTWLIHDGLSTFIRADDAVFVPPDMPGALDAALKAAGCPLGMQQIERTYRRIRSVPLKLHKAHGQPRWEDGLPGETLLFCPCGSVLDSEFDLGAIE